MAHSVVASILSTRLLIRMVLNYFPRLPPQIILSVSWDLGRIEEGEGAVAVEVWRAQSRREEHGVARRSPQPLRSDCLSPLFSPLRPPAMVYDNFTVAVYGARDKKTSIPSGPQSAAKRFSGRRHIR